jgi:DNA-directed RNA polymerase I subunit RPA1
MVIFRNSELVQGVLDKSQFGAKKYGLVHSCFQLYGPGAAGDLLSVLSQLFTIHLQSYGHTCGIGDVCLVRAADDARREIIAGAVAIGRDAARRFADVSSTVSDAEYLLAMQRAFISPDAGAQLDSVMKNAVMDVTSRVIRGALPTGQLKPFPQNCMALMIAPGAKGSMVNFSQISCLLGQQELEGRRVPLMASGNSLPSFRKYDPRPRAGGFVSQRFLTGIRPQEYYFHCMAGREGLVDTAVKTANSGYLQRCLIKHLESLVVQYDYSVRDVDGSIIQFQYGEDAVDVTKSSYLSKFQFLEDNYDAVVDYLNPANNLLAFDCESAGPFQTKLDAWPKKAEKRRRKNKPIPVQPDPLLSIFNPGRVFGVVSEGFSSQLNSYIASSQMESKKQEQFRALMKLAYARSLVDPGESVGVLCGQSIGEPSTQ